MVGLPISGHVNYYTCTTFALNLLYLIFFSVTFATCAYYMLINNRVDTIIIPCIMTLWYKIYTLLLALLALVAILFVFVETNRVRSMGSPMEAYAPYWHPEVTHALQDLDNCLNEVKWGGTGMGVDGLLSCSVVQTR